MMNLSPSLPLLQDNWRFSRYPHQSIDRNFFHEVLGVLPVPRVLSHLQFTVTFREPIPSPYQEVPSVQRVPSFRIHFLHPSDTLLIQRDQQGREGQEVPWVLNGYSLIPSLHQLDTFRSSWSFISISSRRTNGSLRARFSLLTRLRMRLRCRGDIWRERMGYCKEKEGSTSTHFNPGILHSEADSACMNHSYSSLSLFFYLLLSLISASFSTFINRFNRYSTVSSDWMDGFKREN